MQWIKCNDTPPPALTEILVTNGFKRWVWSTDYPVKDKRWELRGITHWMPLPDPPK